MLELLENAQEAITKRAKQEKSKGKKERFLECYLRHVGSSLTIAHYFSKPMDGGVMRSFFKWTMSLCLASVVAACSGRSVDNAPKKVRLKIELGGEANNSQLGFASTVEPSFVGLGVGPDGAQTSYTINLSGENIVEVATGDIPFKATLVSRSTLGDKRLMYVSKATQTVSVNSSTTEVTLVFADYVPTEQVNVYGLVHSSDSNPAANAQISVQDPFSGAWLVAPASAALTESNTHGAFGFSLPLSYFTSAGNIALRVVTPQGSRVLSIPANSNGKPGVTLSYINLTGASETVQPSFTNLTDFDNDGTSNSLEITLGTNPFSELSGQAGATGPTGPVGPTGPAGASGSGTMVRNAAGAVFELLWGSNFQKILKLADGVVFPYSTSDGIWWYGYRDWAPFSFKQCTDAGGTDLGMNCGTGTGNPYPYNWENCYFAWDDNTCSGSCLLPFKPVNNRLLPVCSVSASSGGGSCTVADIRKTTGAEVSTTFTVGVSSPGYYRGFSSYATCQPVSVSSGGGTATFWSVPTSQGYTFPAGVTFPLGTLYLVE